MEVGDEWGLAPRTAADHSGRVAAATRRRSRSNPTVATSGFIRRLLDVDLQRPHHCTATLVQGKRCFRATLRRGVIASDDGLYG